MTPSSGSSSPICSINLGRFGNQCPPASSPPPPETGGLEGGLIHQDYLRHIGESYGPKKSVNRSDEEKEVRGVRGSERGAQGMGHKALGIRLNADRAQDL